jgi:hypothetical protein
MRIFCVFFFEDLGFEMKEGEGESRKRRRKKKKCEMREIGSGEIKADEKIGLKSVSSTYALKFFLSLTCEI